ncbi:hypothetical protein TVAG_134930 [Trichomonas vaginalis G3]|uniref:Uncharacterized protein n=1 Tax=Trichomonas vaginalis (strain ATCC PRA-98 / G3) TaxID=412133 RepID=A2FKH4_TRIV3|nr:armadillo (ARM) repeat-containing protein family [Trichomonas vaginalis G3]EAX94586.1 hypothetical protein TVAG_134930 [Trichomonas vaginalis G3]KAI5542786.1 armadillo (ARM) repeat-containing protein family [Trichomonas vaginalis G3]|eukprot:XP_001307516.1 hypothetical protein [Trichomonas vaginalis G3]
MDLSVLVRCLKGDSSAQETVNEIIENPEYLQPLLDSLSDPQVQSNHDAFWAAATALKELFRRCFYNNKEQDISHEFLQSLISPLLQIISSKPDQTSELVEIIRLCTNLGAKDTCDWLLETISPYLNPNSSDNLLTNLLIICNSIAQKYYATRDINSNEKIEIFDSWMQIYAPLSLHIVEKQKTSINNQLIDIDMQLMRNVLIKCVASLDMEELMQFFISSINLLLVDQNTEAVIKMKSSIIKLFNKIVNDFSNSAKYPSFSSKFNDEIIPILVQNVSSNFNYFIQNRNQLNDKFLCQLLNIVTQLHGITGAFETEDFIANVLIPATILSNDQIVEYFMNPVEYIEFNLAQVVKRETVRGAVCLCLRSFDKFDFTAVLPGDEIENIYEKEARFFIYCNAPRKGKIKRALSNSIHDYFLSLPLQDAATFESAPILSNLEANIDQVREEFGVLLLIPTLMMIFMKADLKSNSLKSEAWELLNVVSQDNYVFQFACISLLKFSIEISFDVGEIPVNELIEKLLAMMNSPQKFSITPDFLKFILENFEEAKQFSNQLLHPLVMQWMELFDELITADEEMMNDDLPENFMNTIEDIKTILLGISEDSLVEASQLMMETAIEAMKINVSQGSEILSCIVTLSNRMKHLSSDYVKFIPVLDSALNAFLENQEEVQLIHISSILINCITKIDEFKTDDSLTQMVIDMVSKVTNPENSEMIFPNDVGSFFVLMSALIFVRPEFTSDILNLVNNYLLGNNELDTSLIHLSAAAFVYATAMMNNQEIAVPQEIVDFYLQNTVIETDNGLEAHPNAPPGIRNAKIWLLCLLYVSRYSNEAREPTVVYSQHVAKMIQNAKEKEEKLLQRKKVLAQVDELDAEEEDFFEEEEDVGDKEGVDEEFVDEGVVLPCESVNPMSLFLQIFGNSELAQFVPEQLFELAKSLSQ